MATFDPQIEAVTAEMERLQFNTQEQPSHANRLDTDDPMLGTGHDGQGPNLMRNLVTSLAIPLFSVVTLFSGVPTLFKKWVREIEKYSIITKLQDHEIPDIAHATCDGSISDFIRRYLDEVRKASMIPSWQSLKKLLQKRFAEITDSQQAMAILRKMRQEPLESVQIFAERLLRVAEDAFPEQLPSGFSAISELQLVDIFCDGLHYDYLRMKILREEPKTLEDAIQVAMKEQNLRKRFKLRSNQVTRQGRNNTHIPPRTLGNPTDLEFRQIEPMEIDRLHGNRKFRTNRDQYIPNRRVQATGENKSSKNHKQQTATNYDPYKYTECYLCHLLGHIKRNCPNRPVPPGNLRPRTTFEPCMNCKSKNSRTQVNETRKFQNQEN